MEYISTRNNNKKFSFSEVFLKGLADDGGLFIPLSIKKFDESKMNSLKKLSYIDLATEIIYLYTGDFLSKKELNEIVKKSYSNFREKDVVKIVELNQFKILELFHGPTLAFKDIAMQLIGNMYEHFLKSNYRTINIVVATSGDTGAAAIDAIKGKSNLNIFVLHPNNRISSVQRKIMTTVEEKNVFNIAIDGNFDDCQNIVKQMFSDLEFSKSINMSGVNSINWARIVAQAVYYFYAQFKLDKDNISFSVPTGNFGDVFAGYLAKKMGLPIDKLIVATNENDILYRAITKGEYISKEVRETLSPSMDIQLASNFERLIYYVNNSSSEKTAEIMKKVKQNSYQIEKKDLDIIKKDFLSESCNEKETLEIIKKNYKENDMVLDPHTAIGVGAAQKLSLNDCVVLSTAHPCKFPDATNNAINKHEKLPEELQHVLNKNENFQILENNTDEVKKFIKSKIL
ncbi:threonine synthase [Candidatus Pelagibacter communis]|uniref:threonine synthase n=1 Tax=Pelagibacter ubique TaxID=198252 RepID=UPI00094D298B|nr:threonine synthase [Candidatus Pelagibacter ubique]